MAQFNAHNHSSGSFLDGQADVEVIMDRAVECGHEAVTITDHGECNQHLRGFKEAQKRGLLFVPGIESYWMYSEDLASARTNKKKNSAAKASLDPENFFSPSHICMLAMTNEGLRNLWALSSVAYNDEHHYYKPIATPELMRQYSAGIYASDGCMLTEFADAITKGDEDKARTILGTLLDIYGDRFYMELHTWQFMDANDSEIDWNGGKSTPKIVNAQMAELNQAKVRFANELGVPLVVVNDSHHSYPEHWDLKELVWAFNTSNNDGDKMAAQLEGMAQKADHLMDADEIRFWMMQHGIGPEVIEEAIKNSHDLASRCEVQIKPTLSMPAMADSERDDLANLISACEEGFKRYVTDAGLDEGRYYHRLQEELTLIADKRFAGYFNMVRDYTMAYRSGTWAQYVKKGAAKDPKLLGPGRGSVGGSLVGYLTGIDTIDPLKYGTLFSRFLSPGRKGLPDVDLDVPQSDRADMLKYFPARYGEENVCLIGTLNRNGPKATIKDVGRALGITKRPGGFADLQAISDHIEDVVRWAKEMKSDDVDAEEELTWAEVIERKGGELRPYQQKYPELFEKAAALIGQPRHAGVHAAGVLVSGTPLMGAVPMRFTRDGRITTQLDMWEIEELGGVKNDMLGIRHLDTLSVARKMIYDRHGVWIDYDGTGFSVPQGCTNVLKFSDEHFNDPAIWPAIHKGHTTGIFQVETSNCTTTAVEFKPWSLKDVADLTSVIRPGVVDAGLLNPYLRRRHGLEPVTYDHPMMVKYLGPGWSTDTYGILVYQEQFIEAVQDLAGFTPDEADDLRKAVGKKQMDKLLLLKDKFIDGCLRNGDYVAGWDTAHAKATAAHIWASIEAAGRYAFNWSHAVGYGMISTWEIWTKHYYPQEFLVASMATDSKNINKYIREARRRELAILPPDINQSDRKFTIEGSDIRYGLDSVRSVGAAACNAILKARPFTSLEDYLTRAGKGADKAKVYNLICIGAFDSIGKRPELLQRLELFRAREGLAESTLNNPEKLEKILANRMASGNYTIEVPDFDNPEVVYGIEKELVGTYVTVDPMERYVPMLDKVAIIEPTDVNTYARNQRFVIGGQVTSIRPTVTKKGRNPGAEMAHITVTWNEADFRIVVFPEAWHNTQHLIKEGAPVACEVKRLDSGCCLESIQRLDILYNEAGIA